MQPQQQAVLSEVVVGGREDKKKERSRKLPIAGEGVTVYVRSKKTLVSSTVIPSAPLFYHLGGPVMHPSRRIQVYDKLLDQEQSELVDEAKSLSKALGIPLEVRDLSKMNFFSRIFASFFRGSIPRRTPAISLTRNAVSEIRCDLETLIER